MSTESNIIDNLVTTLRSINGSPTYVNTIRPQQVEESSQFDSEIELDQYPHFALGFNASQRIKEPGQLKKTLTIDIICTFQDSTVSEVESWLSDVEKVLSIDIRRGGNAFETWIPSIQRNGDVLDDLQVYIMNVEIQTITAFGSL